MEDDRQERDHAVVCRVCVKRTTWRYEAVCEQCAA
jgi:hypothetical protein